jgi:hypothetical protein
MTRVYEGAVLVENDSGNGTSKPFGSMDEFRQIDKGKRDVKDQCETESLDVWRVDLSNEVVKINVLPPECEPPQGGQYHRRNRCRQQLSLATWKRC